MNLAVPRTIPIFSHRVLVASCLVVAALIATPALAQPAKPKDGPLGMKFVPLPKATFYMGGGGGKAGTKTEIKEDFEIAIHTVTQGQWQEVMGNNPSHFSRTGKGKDKVKDIKDEDLKHFPVEKVSWNDAQEFIKKLNEKEKGKGYQYRLPSEAEWEYACRGGATSEEECSYHFYFAKPTNVLSSKEANFDGDSPIRKADKGPNLGRTTKVGSYAPNKVGLYDMHGNIFQWCEDLWENDESVRVNRGGRWDGPAFYCKAGYRDWSVPGVRSDFLGFRLARCSGPGTKGIDPEMVAAYERLGGVYGGWVREDGRTQFVAGRKNAEEGLPGFRFDKLPDKKLPTVAMPFGLSFRGCAEDAQLARLKHLKTLATLDLAQTRVTGAGIKELAALENLSDLDLFWTPISEDELRQLAPLKRLTTLRLTEGVYRTTLSPGAKLTDKAIRVLREIGLLHALRNAEGKNHARPRSAAEVVYLELGLNQVTDAGLKEMLAAFPNIETLNVSHMSVTDAGLEGLVGLKKLTSLMLNGIEMTDAGMKHVIAVNSLTDLTVSRTELTDAGLRGLTALDRLTSLDLGYNELTDAGMKHLAALKGLQRLELCDTKVGDAGVRELTRLERLTALNLNWTQVSDDGLKELVGLKRLTKLSLVYAKATGRGVADLRRVLPGCTIEFARLCPIE